METPVRRLTRSTASTLGPSSAVKPPASLKKEISRRPFSDLTNDSPISGVKVAANTGCVYESTPRSKLRPAERPIGEDLLRMQVTTLLRKVEAEAGIAPRSIPSTPDLLDSPMRLAAPTPANTPATGPLLPLEIIAKQMKQTPPALRIATPVCSQLLAGEAERPARTSLPTTAIVKSPATQVVSDGIATTRTLRFDSPQKVVDGQESAIAIPAEEVESITHLPGDASPFCQLEVALSLERSPPSPYVSTADFLSVIEETSAAEDEVKPTTRILQFDSPAKQVPEAGDLEQVADSEETSTRDLQFESPGKRCPAEDTIDCAFESRDNNGETEDEDSWSVIVNVNTPEKHDSIEAVPMKSDEEDVKAMEFVQNDLLDPSIQSVATDIPSIWEPRDIPSCTRSEVEEEYEDCDDFEDEEEGYEEETYEDGNDKTFDDDACEELCRGISHINMGGGEEDVKKGLPSFEGKHTRFVYNSDDEIEEEEVVTDGKSRSGIVNSPGKMKLKGCATPTGRHLRFNDDDDEDSD